jgi:hypothetical protein
MNTLNGTQAGIQYDNVTYVDTSLQAYCPLEGTALEDQCLNEYHNVQLRPEGACIHARSCAHLLSQSKI